MRKFIWSLLLAVAALVVTLAAGSALEIVAQANTPKAAEPYVVSDNTTWTRGTAPREVGFRERIVSAVRAFRDGRD